jgi:acetyl-CoA acetyltransferase
VANEVRVAGIGMTPMDTRDLGVEELAVAAVSEALADAGVSSREIGFVVVGNALGGRLVEQGCIRGEVWLRSLEFDNAGVSNVDNSCAGGSTAMHLGVSAALAGQSPVLVVGVEKMWAGNREQTMAGIEDGLPADEREIRRANLDNPAGSVLMGMNAAWVNLQIEERGTTIEQIAATTVKARKCGMLNPLAQFRSPVTVDEVLASRTVAGPLTRLMCSSFTDGAAACVLTTELRAGAPRVRASVLRSGNGGLDYHQRLAGTAEEAWKAAGIGPEDVDVTELHDATSAEELYALESLGFFPSGEAGIATLAGATEPGGKGVCVNPSGGLVARGHPLGATGVSQIVELVLQLRGSAGTRQVPRARVGVAVNTGGLINADAASAAVHVLEKT